MALQVLVPSFTEPDLNEIMDVTQLAASSPGPPKKMRKVVGSSVSMDENTQKDAESPVSQYNSRTLQRLKRKLKEDPEIDLLSVLTTNYSKRRRELLSASSEPVADAQTTIDESDPLLQELLQPGEPWLDFENLGFEVPSHLERFCRDCELIVHFPLSAQVLDCLGTSSAQKLRVQDLVRALVKCEVVFEGMASGTTLVLGLDKDVVIKATSEARGNSEHAALVYLRDNCPDIAAPKPLGMISIGRQRLLFMSRFQGCTVESIWPSLNEIQKRSLASKLDLLLSRLRSYTVPLGHPWGALDGSGCIDRRRGTRLSRHVIHDSASFKDFYFTNPLYGSKLWTSILQEIYDSFDRQEQSEGSPCVLTHGDLHPTNIIVQRGQDSGDIDVVGLIDWEASGYYPQFWETLKMTNCLGPHEDLDWYRYLPPSVSLTRYSTPWLLDQVWDTQVAATSEVLPRSFKR